MNFFKKLFGKKNKDSKIVQTQSISQPDKKEVLTDVNGLTEKEIEICKKASIDIADAGLLKSLTRRPIEILEFESGYTETEKPKGIQSLTSAENSKDIVLNNYDRFLNAGKLIFISAVSYNGNKVGILNTTSDPYQVLTYAETNGANYDIDNERVISKLKEWNSRFGVKVIGIGFDWCEVQILNTELNYQDLANEVYEFCPDVVDQGTETIEALEEELRTGGTIYLWWD